MQLTHAVEIDAPPQRVYALLTDIERVAACMPGVKVEGPEGDGYRGTVTIRVGPITAQYAGHFRFVEQEPEDRKVVVLARGMDRNGQGSAEAHIASSVSDRDHGSLLRFDTDLQIRGRVAQFGRGGIEAVADRLITELGTNIERTLAEGAAAPVRAVRQTEVLDLGRAAFESTLRMYARPAAIIGASVALGYLVGAAREARRWARWTRGRR